MTGRQPRPLATVPSSFSALAMRNQCAAKTLVFPALSISRT